MLHLLMRSRSEMFKRAFGGENAWLFPTSRAKLLKEAVKPKTAGQKRVEGAMQQVASKAGRVKSLAKMAAGGTVVYLASKAVGGAGSVVFNASKRRVQSVTGAHGPSKSGSSRGGGAGGNSSSRNSSSRASGGRSSSSRSKGSSSGSRKKTSSGRKNTARKSTASRKTTARKKPTSRRKSPSRKKTTSRSS
jgi:hypothetical protein